MDKEESRGKRASDWCEGKDRKVYRSGTVTGIYPYIFSCQIGRNVACFRYNQIIGNEIGERVMING